MLKPDRYGTPTEQALWRAGWICATEAAARRQAGTLEPDAACTACQQFRPPPEWSAFGPKRESPRCQRHGFRTTARAWCKDYSAPILAGLAVDSRTLADAMQAAVRNA